jgi:RNA polymerase sigma-70 factor, ECF subfamily
MNSSHHSQPPTDPLEQIWRDNQPFLVGLAFKMLSNFGDAEDVVQEAFTRLYRVDLEGIDDVRGWLIVVVSRLCLDDLKSARVRRQDLGVDAGTPGLPLTPDPADRITLDESIGMALLVVLQELTPAERTIFVLHDVFRIPFDTTATIVGRSPEACRKLASRARKRIDTKTETARFTVPTEDQRRVSEQFVAACAGDDLQGLVDLLASDVVGVVDLGTSGSRPVRHGRDDVSRNLLHFFGGSTGATLIGTPLASPLGFLAFRQRQLVALLSTTAHDRLITDVHAIVDPRKIALARLQLQSH